jgi:peptidyl-prolyl cis-trans isomerase B (cyclophilin B)
VTSKDRQRQNERERYERVQARMAEQAAAAKRRNLITAAVAAVAVVGIGITVYALTDSGTKTPPAALPSSTAPSKPAVSPSSSAPAVGYQKGGAAAKDVGVPTYDAAEAAKPYTATLHLSQGDVTFTADTKNAPYTTNSFKFLAGKGYYDGTKCHRLTTSGIYVLQCGDPKGDGSGGPGYQFQDENLANATSYPAGTIAMANAGPGTNGSQFFIVYKDGSQLGPNYTPWGHITAGLDVVQKIATAGTADGGQDGAPKDAVTIKSVTVKAS